jgi:hypothetical protein
MIPIQHEHPETMNMQKFRQAMLCVVLLGPAVLALPGDLAFGQTLVPPPRSIFPSTSDLSRRHMAPTGKACLALEGYAKSQVINPHIFEHWVSAANLCGQNIKLQVCYYKTQDCISMDVPAWGRKDSVLGIYPALPDFRYEAKEQF